MEGLLFFCRAGIGLLFAISSIGKLRDIAGFAQTIVQFRLLPRHMALAAGYVLLCGEFLVVALLVGGNALLLPGFTLAILLLLSFCGALASVIIRRRSLSCNCFGVSEKPVTWLDLWRNAGFLLCAVLGCVVFAWQPRTQANLDGTQELFLFLGAVVFVLVWTQIGDIVLVFRRSA
jgi:Methylamine utilisation protein MauE